MYTNLYRTFVSRDAHNMRLHYRKNKFNESIESHRNTHHKYSLRFENTYFQYRL